MKTLKIVDVVPVFVETIPDTLKQDMIYISHKYKTATHLCLCGCGNLSVTPLNESGWRLYDMNGEVTFEPSILNNNCPNRTHYVIRNDKANILP